MKGVSNLSKEVTLVEGAKLVGRSYYTLRARVATGEIPAKRSGSTWIVNLDDLVYSIAALGIRHRSVQSIKAGR